MRNHLIIFFLLGWSCSAITQSITGTWTGTLDVQGTQLRIVFHVEKTTDGFKTLMDSPDQGAKGIPTDKTTFEENILIVEASALGMKYKGTYSQAEERITGTFQQGPASLPLNLSKEEVKVEKKTRPQDPQDFPYIQENVQFENTVDGVTLAGTLSLPKGQSPSKVVVLISGSGPQNRDEEVASFNHRPFLVLSDYLTRQGIGVLRYDDRGINESTGDFASATTADFSKDTEAAVHYLKARKDLQNTQIGLIGHSEGGMIAPMVAARNKAVDFIVLLAGPGIPIDELMLTQARKVSQASGVPEPIIEANGKVLKNAYTYIKDNPHKEKDDLKEGLVGLFKEGIKAFPAVVQQGIGDIDEFANKEADGLLDPWFLYFIQFNPAYYLGKVQCPVYALNGTLDVQVTAEENLKGIEKALAKAGNKKVKIEAVEGFNHLFQKAKTGSIDEYPEIEETFNEGIMEKITNWIKTVEQ